MLGFIAEEKLEDKKRKESCVLAYFFDERFDSRFGPINSSITSPTNNSDNNTASVHDATTATTPSLAPVEFPPSPPHTSDTPFFPPLPFPSEIMVPSEWRRNASASPPLPPPSQHPTTSYPKNTTSPPPPPSHRQATSVPHCPPTSPQPRMPTPPEPCHRSSKPSRSRDGGMRIHPPRRSARRCRLRG